MNNGRQGMTNAAYAKSRAISAQYIGRLVKNGTIPVLHDGSIDPAAADAARASRVRLRMKATPQAGHGEGYWQARTAREVFSAKLLQLEYARETGKLLDADKTLELVTSAFANCRIRLRSLPKSLAAVLANRTPAEVEAILCIAIDGALVTLSNDVLAPPGASESTGDATGSDA